MYGEGCRVRGVGMRGCRVRVSRSEGWDVGVRS